MPIQVGGYGPTDRLGRRCTCSITAIRDCPVHGDQTQPAQQPPAEPHRWDDQSARVAGRKGGFARQHKKEAPPDGR